MYRSVHINVSHEFWRQVKRWCLESEVSVSEMLVSSIEAHTGLRRDAHGDNTPGGGVGTGPGRPTTWEKEQAEMPIEDGLYDEHGNRIDDEVSHVG